MQTGKYNFEFHKMGEISWLAENLVSSQQGFYSMELDIYLVLIIILIDKLSVMG